MNEIVRASVDSNINEINDQRNVELFPEIWAGGSDCSNTGDVLEVSEVVFLQKLG